MSSFVVSARKYRPVRFDEVVGQGHVTDTLKRAIISDKIAHAFLFCGPRGVGKTTCARILAKALNCQNPSEDKEPCNTCDSCQAFNDNASFNIIELDAASHNSVDNIRKLVEQVQIQPTSGSYKIFIIDEVHMLTTSAFNAFLKTLEEPPPYGIFILATTEKHKILPTILSRCQIYDFKRIDVNDIVGHLKQISEAEKVGAEEEALYVVAQKADGALRDALSMFDRLSNQSDEALTYQQVIESLGIVDYETYFSMMDHILAENPAGLLMVLNQFINAGYEAEEVVKGLAAHIRDLLYFKYDKLQPLVSLPEQLLERYRNQAALSSESLLVNALDIMTDALYRAQLSPDKKLLFEITLTKIAYISRLINSPTSIASNGSETSIEKKKTSVSTSNPVNLPAPKVVVDRRQQPRQPASTSVPDQVESPAQTPAPAQAEATKKPTAAVVDRTQTKHRATKTTSIMSSLQEIASQIDKEKSETKEARELNDKTLVDMWEAFIVSTDSDYVRQMLQTTEITLKDNEINIVIDHKRVKEAITREFNCIMFFREKFAQPELVVNINLDESMAGEQEPTKRLITNKEKFEFLVEKNPNILEMTRRFNLKFD